MLPLPVLEFWSPAAPRLTMQLYNGKFRLCPLEILPPEIAMSLLTLIGENIVKTFLHTRKALFPLILLTLLRYRLYVQHSSFELFNSVCFGIFVALKIHHESNAEKLIIPQRDSISISSDFHFWQVVLGHSSTVCPQVCTFWNFIFISNGVWPFLPGSSHKCPNSASCYNIYLLLHVPENCQMCVYATFVDLLRHIWAVIWGLWWVILLSTFCTSFCYTGQHVKREALF